VFCMVVTTNSHCWLCSGDVFAVRYELNLYKLEESRSLIVEVLSQESRSER
jgi:hypothetical protein